MLSAALWSVRRSGETRNYAGPHGVRWPRGTSARDQGATSDELAVLALLVTAVPKAVRLAALLVGRAKGNDLMSKVTLSHVYIVRGVVSAWVETSASTVHKVGHLPFEGWFCTCKRGKRCAQIGAVKALVPVAAIEAGARGVEAGHVKGGVCAPEGRVPVHA